MNWYYKTDSGKIGPISQTEMDELVQRGIVGSDTMVWNDYCNKWQTYNKAVNGEDASDNEQWSQYGGSRNSSSCQQNYTEPPKYKPVLNTSISYETCHQIEFTGSGGEYFRIWIVNLLLTVATLGIYSAWAKVRRNKYFYRNTRIDGSSFDYHGKPIAILKGRLIAALLLGTLFLFKNIIPAYYLFGLIIFGAFLPWLVTKSLAFRMRNTSWRSMRFKFNGTVGEASKVFYIYGLISMVFWPLYPMFYHRQKAFLFNNTSFGKETGHLGISSAPFYGVILRTAGIIALSTLIIFLLSSTVLATTFHFFGTKSALLFLIPALIYLSFIFIGFPFFQTRMANLIWNNLTLGSIKFVSSLKFGRFAWITMCNTILTFVTLGIYWPWAVINLTRYRAESLTIVAHKGLDQFEAEAAEEESAVGEEITEAYDFDISF
ncbi:MAG: DUF898 family protein [Nitrospirae bacterium]|nr:DUF898 family protein [Nitrospirota bacterium]